MADFAPPGGPPPPKVPEGWKAMWNEQYSEWYYVNLQTGKSTWEKPTAPAYSASSAEPPTGAPPGYTGPGTTGAEKSLFHSNNPYNSQTSQSTIDDDARLAAQLQAEEDDRARGSGGARPTSRNAQNDIQQSYAQQDLPPREQKHSSGLGGLLSKITGRHSGGSHQSPGSQAQYQQGGYGYPPQGYSQGYQQQSYGGYPPQQQGYGYGPPQGGGYGGGYGGGGYGGGYGQPPRKSRGGGLGTAGGAALGLGAGLVGGALVADAIDDHDDREYDQGYEDGGGGDYGGGDDGGGGE